MIYDAMWALEVTIKGSQVCNFMIRTHAIIYAISPGVYRFKIPDVLSSPVAVRIRDYVHIRDFFNDKLDICVICDIDSHLRIRIAQQTDMELIWN